MALKYRYLLDHGIDLCRESSLNKTWIHFKESQHPHVTQLENKCPQVSSSFSAICLLKDCCWMFLSLLSYPSTEIQGNPTIGHSGRAFTNNTLAVQDNLGLAARLCDAPHRHAPLHSHHWRHWWNTWSPPNLTKSDPTFFAPSWLCLASVSWYEFPIPKHPGNSGQLLKKRPFDVILI